MSHLDEGTLHALLDGEIPSAELGAIQTHLAGCAECRNRLEQERGLASEAMDLVELIEVPQHSGRRAPGSGYSFPETRPSPRGVRRTWVWGVAWAATLVGAVGLGYAMRGAERPPATPALDAAAPLTVQAQAESAGAPEKPRADPNPPSPGPARAVPVPRPTAGKAVAAGNPATRDQPPAQTREQETAATPPALAAPASALRAQSNLAIGRTVSDLAARQEAAGFAAAKLSVVGAEPISFPEAMRRLNGTIRLIQGMIPLRLEAKGPVIHVVYPLAEGELLLTQQVVNDQVTYWLLAPPGFPIDSLERLRERVRE